MRSSLICIFQPVVPSVFLLILPSERLKVGRAKRQGDFNSPPTGPRLSLYFSIQPRSQLSETHRPCTAPALPSGCHSRQAAHTQHARFSIGNLPPNFMARRWQEATAGDCCPWRKGGYSFIDRPNTILPHQSAWKYEGMSNQ